MRLSRLRALLFDMDGVLYRGRTPLPGAAALLSYLDGARVPYALVTNNSTRTPRQYARLLAQMGMRVPAARIVTSATSTAAYLRRVLRPGARVLVVGEAALRRALVDAGFAPAGERPAAVVVGLDRRVSYRKLAAATQALLDGARFVLTNPDLLLPTDAGVIPGAGSLAAALQAATGRRPTVIGKPHPRLLREALARLGVAPAESAIVGDQVATDVAAGRAAGLYTILVRTGVGATGRRPRGPRPDLVVRDLRELHRRLVAAGLRPQASRRTERAVGRRV
ncbi:MAG: HAD-IIA family hydrolase [Armatimonadota bacterium]|nr:HAD-IIA family hydrolase [Armatimonadota bacterium]